MDSTNLAVVLAPNIMHVNSKSETMKSCEEKLLQVQTSVVELLINHADEVGMVDEQLAERTAFMSEVFSTDDELDASEDNLEDSKETRKKEKKRKRSGSFQGFVSSIAQSITKWRRSTDGKTNTSGLSQGSNASQMSTSSHKRVANRTTDDSDAQQVFQFSATDVTPIMRKKKTALPATEGKAFSASKKKAILNHLPQHTALASTPFTPASSMRKMDINSVRRAQLDTPSMPPRPYQCTPRQNMKTPRKKIALFSPASTTKKKRYSSTTNLSVQSAGKKTGKSKGIFRRLSGSKGDQAFPENTEKDISHLQIGQRLASPTSTSSHSTLQPLHKTIKDESPIAAIAQNASFSASMCEQSVISHCDDERRSLNEGFIVTGDDKEVDISRIMSEPVISGSFAAGEYVMLGDIPAQESVSDSMIICQSRSETPKGHNRSYSFDSILDNSTKKGSLKRGRPNSIKAGLLQGDQTEVHKLRRSFGLDKSDIGYPIPLSVADVSDSEHYIQLECSIDDYVDSKKQTYDDEQGMPSGHDADRSEDTSQDSPGSVSRCQSTVSVASVTLSDSKCRDSAAGYECDEESEAGFSTISGGTAIFVPEMKLCTTTINIDDTGDNSYNDLKFTKTLADQKQQSKDSLFSEASSSYYSPPLISRDREMTRSISADSGKGSMCEEPMEDESSNATFNVVTSSVLDQRESFKSAADTTIFETSTQTELANFDESLLVAKPTNLQNKKSVSSQDLNRECDRTPSRVSRSKSLLNSSTGQRKNNVKPNLQISAETHKLLARAGYIKEQKAEQMEEFDDFAIPASVKFPLMLKQADTLNPRRESLIAIQKNNAGYVRNNVRQFDRIAEDTKDLISRHESPFRFPNSTTRKRGMSPLTIPNAFAKSSHRDIEAIRQAMNTSTEKVSFGTAKVPISTHLIKPSDLASQSNNTEADKNTPLKRKPSIYYADRDGAIPALNKYRYLASNSLNITKEENQNEHDTTTQSCDVTDNDILEDSVFEVDPDSKKSILDGHPLDLNESLQDTINSVCTPRSEMPGLDCSKIDKGNKENSVAAKKCPEIKASILTTPVKIDSVTWRTASNKTPVEILRTSHSPRSPIKPVKRLGSSPHSPRCRTVRSPKMVKNNRRSLLTTIPDQFDELNNL